MKTKITNWVTLLSLAGFVILFSMGVKSQQKENVQSTATKQDSIVPVIGLKIPDSTVVKVQDKSTRISKIDSLKAVDHELDVKNEIGIKTAIKKKEKFEQYRKTPIVDKIPPASPSLVVSKPTLPDSINLKKKSKRSVFDKVRDFINKP